MHRNHHPHRYTCGGGLTHTANFGHKDLPHLHDTHMSHPCIYVHATLRCGGIGGGDSGGGGVFLFRAGHGGGRGSPPACTEHADVSRCALVAPGCATGKPQVGGDSRYLQRTASLAVQVAHPSPAVRPGPIIADGQGCVLSSTHPHGQGAASGRGSDGGELSAGMWWCLHGGCK